MPENDMFDARPKVKSARYDATHLGILTTLTLYRESPDAAGYVSQY